MSLAQDNSTIALPDDGRTVTTLTDYLANNALFNVKDYGAIGDGSTDDTTTIQAALTAAGAVSSSLAFGACVYLPPGTYKVTAQLTASVGSVVRGAGMRATRIASTYAGFAIKIGTTGSSLAYGCGIDDLSFSMSNTNGGAIQAIGTSGFFARNVYIEGVVSGACTAIFLDGGAAANLFSVLDNVDCNHVKIGLHLGTSGAQVTTSVSALGFNALTDLQSGAIGIQVDALSGAGSRFFGGNMENCTTGISISGFACQFFGMRFEGNTADLLLNSGAQANVFVGCSGWTTVTDSSGATSNSFWGNHSGSYTNYPTDTLGPLASGITFGPNLATITNPTQIAIANNATGTLAIGQCCQLLVYDSGVTANAATLLITPSSGGTKLLLTQTNTTFTLTPTTAGKINFSLSGTTLNIENKLGSNTTVKLLLTTLA